MPESIPAGADPTTASPHTSRRGFLNTSARVLGGGVAALALAGTPLAAGGPAAAQPAPTPPAEVLWSAGHEAGNMGEWWGGGCGGEFNSAGGVSGATTEVAHSGSYAARLHLPDPTHQQQGVRLFRWCEAIQNSALYYSAWYYFPRQYRVNGWWHIMQFKSNGSFNAKFILAVGNRPDGQMYILLGRGNDSGGGAWHQDHKNLPVGQWVHLEVYAKKAADNTGRITVWQDGVQIIDVPGVQTANSDNFSWAPINYGQGIGPVPVTIYVDDAAISTARVGP